MGANAQTTVPTFTLGQVLTADQMNQSARTGVPVFAGTAERDAAFGGTGEKTLAEGQLCYLESTNVVQYYDGSSWATVGPAATPGLTLITTTSFTNQSTVNVNGCFSATYDHYRIVFSNWTSNGNVQFRLRNAGTDRTGSDYEVKGSEGANVTVNYTTTNVFLGGTPPAATFACIEVFTPYISTMTTGLVVSAAWNDVQALYKQSNQNDSFTLYLSTGTQFSGTLEVFGYAT